MSARFALLLDIHLIRLRTPGIRTLKECVGDLSAIDLFDLRSHRDVIVLVTGHQESLSYSAMPQTTRPMAATQRKKIAIGFSIAPNGPSMGEGPQSTYAISTILRAALALRMRRTEPLTSLWADSA